MGTPLWWAIAGTTAAALVAAVAGAGRESLFGIGAPVITSAASWVVMERAWVQAPTRLQPVMIRGFAWKCAFFLVYVAVMLRVVEVRPTPFVLSLVASFLVLHFVEAWCLKRMMESSGKAGSWDVGK